MPDEIASIDLLEDEISFVVATKEREFIRTNAPTAESIGLLRISRNTAGHGPAVYQFAGWGYAEHDIHGSVSAGTS